MVERNSLYDLDSLARNYLCLSINLASQGLSIEDFHNQLYEKLSRRTGISSKFLEHITQPFANLHFFQNRNNGSNGWNDSWIDFSKGRVELKEKPTDEEMTGVIEPFLKMYWEEISIRIRASSQH